MYYAFIDEYTGQQFGSFEVFELDDGWYWWSCRPGCLPDGESFGPFVDEPTAIEDARWGA